MMHRLIRISLALSVIMIATNGCGWRSVVAPYSSLGNSIPIVEAAIPNPLFVPVVDREFVWNQVVDEIDNYFKIRREERVRLVGHVLTEGSVETFPTIGSTLLEPWRRDSTPGFEKLHASLQSIRRQAHVRVIPTQGGYMLEVAVYKELEDVLQPEHASVGGSTLRYDTSPERTDEDHERLPPGTLGWIRIGRDMTLEQQILSNLRGRLAVSVPPQGLPAIQADLNVPTHIHQ